MSPRRNWDSPNPSLASECAPPPEPGGGGTHACWLGVGGVPIPTTGEKLSNLPTLCLTLSFICSDEFHIHLSSSLSATILPAPK
jgi:hypothetical protein